jgi:hypothetical protein
LSKLSKQTIRTLPWGIPQIYQAFPSSHAPWHILTGTALLEELGVVLLSASPDFSRKSLGFRRSKQGTSSAKIGFNMVQSTGQHKEELGAELTEHGSFSEEWGVFLNEWGWKPA